MDFLKKKSSAADDDIIELTDIIQKGKEATAVKSSKDQSIETQMENLFSGGNKESKPIVPDDMDADIDALLADMQDVTIVEATPNSTTQAANSAPDPTASTSQPLMNPDEELEMPNMAEVDALLEGLDIPPQPTAGTPLENTATDSDELDDLLNGLTDGPAKSPKNTPKPTTMNLDDLDDLLATDDIIKPAPAASPAVNTTEAPWEEKTSDLDADLDALLGFSTPAPAAEAKPKAKAKASPEAAPPAESPVVTTAPAPATTSFEDDLDALFTADAPPAPVAEAKPKATAKASPEAASPVESPVAKTASTDDMSLEDDLDALLAAVAPPAPAAAAAKPKATAKASPEAASPAEPPVAKTAPAADMDLEDDLDALFTSTASLAHIDPSADTTLLTLEDDLDAILGTATRSPAAKPPLAASTSSDDEVVDMSDLGGDTTEDLLADIFDTPKSDTSNTTLDNDLLAGLDVVDGLDGIPRQAKDTRSLADIEKRHLPTPVREEQLTTLDTQDVAMLSATDTDDMPLMPDSSPKDELDLPELDELDELLNSPAMQETPAPTTAGTTIDIAAAPAAPAIDNATALDIDMLDMPVTPDIPVSPHKSTVSDTGVFDADAMDLALDFDVAEKHIPLYEDHEFTDADIARAAQELLDEKVMAEATTGDVDTNAWLDSLDEILSETDDGEDPAITVSNPTYEEELLANGNAVNLDNLLDQLPDSTEATHYIYSPISPPPKKASQSAVLVSSNGNRLAPPSPASFDQAYEQGIARLQHITDRFASSLAEADARITALTQTTAADNAVGTMLCEDSPFSATLQNLVRTAVATELRAHTTEAPPSVPPSEEVTAPVSKAEYTALLEKMLAVENTLHTLQDRLTALEDGNKEARLQTVETRLDGQSTNMVALEERCKVLEQNLEAQALSQSELEKRFQHEVEKAAAAAAARIIREEIAGILSGQ